MLPDESLKVYRQLDYSNSAFQGQEPFVIHADFDKTEEFPDFFYGKNIFTYSFCVSDKMKEILESYSNHLNMVPFFITDRKYRDQRVYWRIRLETVRCFKRAVHPSVQTLEWEKKPEDEPFIFLALQEKAQYLIVALELAENILRRHMFGVRFVRIREGKCYE